MRLRQDRNNVPATERQNQEWKYGVQTTPQQHKPREASDNIPSSSKVGMKQFNKTP